MKTLSFAILLLLLSGCAPKDSGISIRLQKRAGEVTPYGGMWEYEQKDNNPLSELFPDVKVPPKGWSDVHYYYSVTDYPQAMYQSYRQGQISKDLCMSSFDAWGEDTLNYSPTPCNVFITSAIGIDEKNDTCIVFDSNANLDLSDDKPMLLSAQEPIPVAFERWLNGRVVSDTTFVYTQLNGGVRYLKIAEVSEQSITHQGIEYKISIDNAMFETTAFTKVKFSTPGKTDIYRPGQYVCLGDAYYLMDSLSADNRFLHLTEAPDALSKEALQIGFRPYPFTITDLKGKTYHFPDDFKGKYVLLDFWSTGCRPCVDEIRHIYPSVYEKYHDAGFEILAISDNTSGQLKRFEEETSMPWIVVSDRDQGRKAQKLYNISYYPTVFLVGPDGRICKDEYSLRGPLLEDTLEELFFF